MAAYQESLPLNDRNQALHPFHPIYLVFCTSDIPCRAFNRATRMTLGTTAESRRMAGHLRQANPGIFQS